MHKVHTRVHAMRFVDEIQKTEENIVELMDIVWEDVSIVKIIECIVIETIPLFSFEIV